MNQDLGGALVVHLPNSERDKARVHQFGKNVSAGLFIGYALIADQRGKTIVCKTDNFVPLVVPKLSTSSGSNSLATSTPQDLSSTSPAQKRSDELASGNWSGSPPKT